MRLTPAQIAVRLICDAGLPPGRPPKPGPDRIRAGHEMLVRLTGKNFGYDLQAWHDHLKESRQGGYTYGRNIVLPRIMQDALSSPEWQLAVQRLTPSGGH